jgi:ribosomal protein L6P/L9E
MLEGVTVSESKTQKDELILEGNDVQNVSQSGKFRHLLVLCFVAH